MLFYLSDLCRYLTYHLLESIHIWTIGTIHGWLPLVGFMCLAQCPWVELEVKIYDIFRFFVRFFFSFIVFEHQVQFRVDIFSVTSDLTVQCHRVGLEVKIYFYMRTLRASSVGVRASRHFSNLLCFCHFPNWYSG